MKAFTVCRAGVREVQLTAEPADDVARIYAAGRVIELPRAEVFPTKAEADFIWQRAIKHAGFHGIPFHQAARELRARDARHQPRTRA